MLVTIHLATGETVEFAGVTDVDGKSHATVLHGTTSAVVVIPHDHLLYLTVESERGDEPTYRDGTR